MDRSQQTRLKNEVDKLRGENLQLHAQVQKMKPLEKVVNHLQQELISTEARAIAAEKQVEDLSKTINNLSTDLKQMRKGMINDLEEKVEKTASLKTAGLAEFAEWVTAISERYRKSTVDAMYEQDRKSRRRSDVPHLLNQSKLNTQTLKSEVEAFYAQEEAKVSKEGASGSSNYDTMMKNWSVKKGILRFLLDHGEMVENLNHVMEDKLASMMERNLQFHQTFKEDSIQASPMESISEKIEDGKSKGRDIGDSMKGKASNLKDGANAKKQSRAAEQTINDLEAY